MHHFPFNLHRKLSSCQTISAVNIHLWVIACNFQAVSGLFPSFIYLFFSPAASQPPERRHVRDANHPGVLVSSAVVACRSLKLLSASRRGRTLGSGRPSSFLTCKLCWCQMSSRWQLDMGRSILTGSPVSLRFCSPSKAMWTLPPSLSATRWLSLFRRLPPLPAPSLARLYHQPGVRAGAASLRRISRCHGGYVSSAALSGQTRPLLLPELDWTKLFWK